MNKKILKLEYIYGIILIIFLYFLFLYPQDFKSLVVGSYSSVQLIQTQKYIIDFIDNLNYPFVFNLANGFDLIADSPQSVLHPLYVVINFCSKTSLDSCESTCEFFIKSIQKETVNKFGSIC